MYGNYDFEVFGKPERRKRKTKKKKAKRDCVFPRGDDSAKVCRDGLPPRDHITYNIL